MRRFLLALPLALVPLAVSGCTKEDPEIVIRTSRVAAAKFASILPDLFDPEVLPSPGEDRLVGRVRQRLRLDRWLGEVPLKISRDGDTVVVAGPLNDLTLRQRAIDLAETTRGVEKVRGEFADEPDNPK